MSEEIRWVAATTLDDLWEGDLLDVEVEGEQVMLVNLGADGGVKAYQGMCPHQEILLADGKWDPDTAVLLCHGHNWEFDRIAKIDLAILRLAMFEMIYRKDIPPVVSINEAIDLSKDFSNLDSKRFINGILDRLKGELGRDARKAE